MDDDDGLMKHQFSNPRDERAKKKGKIIYGRDVKRCFAISVHEKLGVAASCVNLMALKWNGWWKWSVIIIMISERNYVRSGVEK